MEEKTIWSGSASQVVNLGAYSLSAFVFLLFVALLTIFWKSIAASTILLTAALLIVCLPLFFALGRWVSVKTVHYEVTSERIRTITGIFSKRTTIMELYRVKDYLLEEPFFFRIFKLGNIVLLTSDASSPRIELSAVPRARWLLDELRTAVEARRDLKRVRAIDFDAEAAPPHE
jgi:uncharacterized membrane protein YdbT with pleckstrin-like domain